MVPRLIKISKICLQQNSIFIKIENPRIVFHKMRPRFCFTMVTKRKFSQLKEKMGAKPSFRYWKFTNAKEKFQNNVQRLMAAIEKQYLKY